MAASALTRRSVPEVDRSWLNEEVFATGQRRGVAAATSEQLSPAHQGSGAPPPAESPLRRLNAIPLRRSDPATESVPCADQPNAAVEVIVSGAARSACSASDTVTGGCRHGDCDGFMRRTLTPARLVTHRRGDGSCRCDLRSHPAHRNRLLNGSSTAGSDAFDTRRVRHKCCCAGRASGNDDGGDGSAFDHDPDPRNGGEMWLLLSAHHFGTPGR